MSILPTAILVAGITVPVCHKNDFVSIQQTAARIDAITPRPDFTHGVLSAACVYIAIAHLRHVENVEHITRGHWHQSPPRVTIANLALRMNESQDVIEQCIRFLSGVTPVRRSSLFVLP